MSAATSRARIVTARRTPFAPVHGLLSGWHPVDLLAHTMHVTLDDAGVDPEEVELVLVGCAHPVGAQSMNLGRAALLAAGWPSTIPATTVERGAGSSHRALQLAAQAIAAGSVDLAVVAGVEVMSLVPAGAPGLNRQYGSIWGPTPARRYEAAGGLVPAGVAGDRLARAHHISRADQDTLTRRCRRQATDVAQPSWLVVTPTRTNDRDHPRRATAVLLDDEPDTLPEECTPPLHDEDGTVAATNVAPPADGASVAVLASERWVRTRAMASVATVAATAEAAIDPVTMFGAGPVAVARVLERADTAAGSVQRVELDAPHAAAALHMQRSLGFAHAEVNGSGGGLGRGRPLGAIGVAMVAELIGRAAHAHRAVGPALLVDENDDGTATATLLASPDRSAE